MAKKENVKTITPFNNVFFDKWIDQDGTFNYLVSERNLRHDFPAEIFGLNKYCQRQGYKGTSDK